MYFDYSGLNVNNNELLRFKLFDKMRLFFNCGKIDIYIELLQNSFTKLYLYLIIVLSFMSSEQKRTKKTSKNDNEPFNWQVKDDHQEDIKYLIKNCKKQIVSFQQRAKQKIKNYKKQRLRDSKEKQQVYSDKADLQKRNKQQQKDQSLKQQANQAKRKKVHERCAKLDKRSKPEQDKGCQVKLAQNYEQNDGAPFPFDKRKKDKQVTQKLPCSFCDKLLSFQELDKHHNSCKLAFKCQLCQDFFPKIFRDDHKRICKKKGKKTFKEQAQHPKKPEKRTIKYQEQKEEEKYYLNEDELNQSKFMSLYPQIDPQILRQHLKAEKENKIHKKRKQKQSWKGYDRNRQRQNFQDFQRVNSRDYYQLNHMRPSRNVQNKSAQKEEGLNARQIGRLITDFYAKGQNNEDECSICTKEKEEGEVIIRLPCFHTYHKDCILPWVQVKSVCPDCKFDLKYKPK